MAYKQKSNPFLKTIPFKNHVPGHGLSTDEQGDLYFTPDQYTTDSLKWVKDGWRVKDVESEEDDEGNIKKTRVWVQEKDQVDTDEPISTLEKIPLKPLEPIVTPEEKELEIPTQSVSLSSERQRQPTYAYQQYRGFQIPIAMNIWDESSNSWKRRPLEPEEIEYEKNKVRERTGG